MDRGDGSQAPIPFGADWARALQRELDGSEEFRRAVGGWEGRLVLESRDRASGATARAVALHLADGACREARPADPSDRAAAAFVIAGSAEAWDRMLDGEASPLTALLRGQLKLVKGSVAGLMPFAPAAEQLVKAAARVATLPAAAGAAAAAPAAVAADTSFRSMRPDGIDFDSVPMQLWQKAKRFGIWDPRAIDFRADRRDWLRLEELERDVLLRLAALFGAGEESVTRELLPLIRVIARQGLLEEEMFLAAFLWEEAKHVEAFRVFFDEVAVDGSDLSRFHTPSYRRIFYDELPQAMSRLDRDDSPVALARASTTYNMIVEGVLAETGYHVYHSVLEGRGILPGMRQVVAYLQRDESRHLAYGVHLLSRLVGEHGEPVWRAIEARMDELIGPAVAIIEEVFVEYETPPFGLEPATFVDFAMEQFRKRLARVERARHQPPG